jgi:hypothetical protein
MRRTTVFVEDDVLDGLRAMARRRGISLAQITREGLATYVALRQGKRRPLIFLAVGRAAAGMWQSAPKSS